MIKDPSGNLREVELKAKTRISATSEDSDIELRDPTILPGFTLDLSLKAMPNGDSVFWYESATDHPPILVGENWGRSGALLEHMEIKLGETTLKFIDQTQTRNTPTFPSRAAHWLTRSETGRKLLWDSFKVADSNLNVYIKGETGTGKEVIAHLVHRWSKRSAGPFIPINCGALAPSLAESELFGHVKGAYTGAEKSRPGAFLRAHSGTLFLDEVADLTMELQVKLLRFLEDGEIRPVGADHLVHSDVRVLCATHKSLVDLVKQGKFRQDLYYRIASVTLSIPNLRSRPEDVELLAKLYSKNLGKLISKMAIRKLQSYAWPGNVRELRHQIEKIVSLIGPFEKVINSTAISFEDGINCENIDATEMMTSGILTIKEAERVLLLKSLNICNGNRTEAARVLGIARSTLFEMLKRHRIHGPKRNYALIA